MNDLPTELWAACAAAFSLGAAHALEVDHMVAVSAFVGGNPKLRPAIGFGVRWGVGHAAIVLIAGGLLAWSGITIPLATETWLEGLVGIALVAVGLWTWRNARRLHVHVPGDHGDHGHLHAHPASARHEHVHAHPHFSTMVGAVHGLAGTAPIVALVPVTLLPTLGSALLYLLSFGLGTIVGMGTYAGLAAFAVGRAAQSLRFARSLAFATSLLSVAVGAWWLARLAWD